MDILSLESVRKRFGAHEVLKGLSFSVPEHTLFGFVGQNGAGKTTTMKLILGLLEQDSGRITVNGETVNYGQTATNRFIGYLPDVPEFYSFMTPLEYLRFCGEISGMAPGDITPRAEEMLSLVGLADVKHRIHGFSRGMKQRLGIAQALLSRPKLLICDEPTSALDPIGRKEILDILVAVKKQTTVVFSTHILSDVERICDEIAFLHDGHIVLQGTLDEVKSRHKSSGFEVELESPRDLPQLLTAFPEAKQQNSTLLLFEHGVKMDDVMAFLLERNISIVKIEKREPSLESLFLEVVGK
jgi:ABC-2 type transport system ATP-binding protein